MPENQAGIVVIGAGLAGLAAAQRIGATGRSVTILEARDRIGGRVHTLRPPDWPIPLETGAEFIHGDPHELWDAVSHAKLATEEVTGSDLISTGGQVKPFDMGAAWSPVFQRLREIPNLDISFQEFLGKYGSDFSVEQKRLARGYVEGFNAADSRLISCRWLVESDEASGQGGDAGAFRLPAGYDRVVEWFASQLSPATELRLNTVVDGIHWKHGAVEIHSRTASGSACAVVQAAKAVVTLPLGVLKMAPHEPGAVRFLPDLTEKWAACSGLHMGNVVKLVLRFQEPFWADKGYGSLGFLHAKEQPFPTWWTTSPRLTPVITGWAGGPAADTLSLIPPKEIVSVGIESLANSLDCDREQVANLLVDWHLSDWKSDPYSRGAYSYVGIGGLEASRRLAEPVDDTLFFAGEATHDRLSATVAGAIASGYRAAAEVLGDRAA